MGELWWQLLQLVCLGCKARAQLYVCAYSCICAWQQNTNVLFWAYRWLKNALPSFWQSKLLKSRQKDYTHQPISTLRPCRGCTQEGHLPRNQIGSISGTMTRLTMKPGRETLQQNYQGKLWAIISTDFTQLIKYRCILWLAQIKSVYLDWGSVK